MAGLMKLLRGSNDIVTLDAYQEGKLARLPQCVQELLFEAKIYPDEAEERFEELLVVLMVQKYARGARKGDEADSAICEQLITLLEEEEERASPSRADGAAGAAVPSDAGAASSTAAPGTAHMKRSPRARRPSLSAPDDGSAFPTATRKQKKSYGVKLMLRRTRFHRQNTPLGDRRLTAGSKKFEMFLKPMAGTEEEERAAEGERVPLRGRLSPASSPARRRRSPAVARPASAEVKSVDDAPRAWIQADPKEKYCDFRRLGEGSFGTVYLAEDREQKKRQEEYTERVAIKKLPACKPRHFQDAANEIDLLTRAAHKYVVGLRDVYLHNDHVWLVMEYCDGGTLEQLLCNAKPTEAQAKFILKKLLIGLDHLHSKDIIHCDIKCENVLMNFDARVKIADLGIAKHVNNVHVAENHSVGGTPRYMAPEMGLGAAYCSKVDVYSFGCIAYEVLTQERPHDGYHALKAVFRTCTRGAPSLPQRVSISDDAVDFLRCCLRHDQDARWSTKQLLKHRWFAEPCSPTEMIALLETAFLGGCLKAAGLGGFMGMGDEG